MITIRGTSEQEEQEIVAQIEQLLKGRDVDIFQNEGEEATIEEIATYLAYNLKQTRIYTGRLERNSRKIEEDIRPIADDLVALLSPLATYFNVLLAREVGDEKAAGMILRRYHPTRIRNTTGAKDPTFIGSHVAKATVSD